MNPDQVKAIIEAIKTGDSASALALLEQMLVAEATDDPGDAAPPAPPGANPTDGTADPSAGDASAMAALARALGTDVGGVVSAVTQLRERVDAQERREAVIELGARRDLVAELVKLGVEIPATAWSGDPAQRQPCKRLMAEPIAELRARVEQLRAARPVAPQNAPPDGRPDVASGTELDVVAEIKKLSREEIAKCKARGISLEDYVERKHNAVRRVV